MEKTFVMLKPDAVNRGLSGEIISRLENKGLKMVAAKFMMVSENLAKTHYSEHEGKNFFESLIDYITSGPSFAMVFEGDQAISVCRTVVGATDPKVALPGTIRGDYGMDKGRNLIHASDSLESAKREIDLFFKSNEILEYEHHSFKWIYE